MKKSISIEGYGNYDFSASLGFDTVYEYDVNHIPVFVGLLVQELKVGDKLTSIAPKDGDSIPIELEVMKMHLGFADMLDSVPRGFQTIALVKGSEKNIALLKSQLKEIGTWRESTEEYIASVA